MLAADSLAIALQPIVGLDSGRWVEVEALTRFPDGRAPDVWFAEAHEVGLGVDLEMAAVRAALRTLGQLPEGVTLAVNASPQLILDPRLARALTAPGVPTARIAVEMTEHAAVAHYEEIRQVLAPLRALGLRVAVDDTGAGYSSFSHVLTLRPDVIKLDRSLVAGVDADPARRAFITAVVLLALELGAEVTAEGVETASEQLTLATLGVDRAQGYHLARPTTEARQWQTWRARCWASAVPMPTGRLRVG
ncbi:MAG TPA: EAL domain-containing protein [Acidimicrobiales bacterium]|nr:EAL domain-containing protein [Acidimicrobiales bacterium]